MAALRERSQRHEHSMQRELLAILEQAAAEGSGVSNWSREEIYGSDGR
jgi:plasmid stability protein